MYYLETIHVFPTLSHTKHSRENCSSFRAVGVRTSPATVWRLEGMPLGSLHLLHQLLTPKIYWRYRKGHEDIPLKVKPSEKHEVMFQWVYVLAVVFVSLRIVLFTVEVVMQLQVFNLLCWDYYLMNKYHFTSHSIWKADFEHSAVEYKFPQHMDRPFIWCKQSFTNRSPPLLHHCDVQLKVRNCLWNQTII